MIDKSSFKSNRVISPETKYVHLMKVIEEFQLRFLTARLKGETFTLAGNGQSRSYIKEGFLLPLFFCFRN